MNEKTIPSELIEQMSFNESSEQRTADSIENPADREAIRKEDVAPEVLQWWNEGKVLFNKEIE